MDFSLKKAYATLNDWTIGYASTTFSDPQALPPSVDAQGPNNKMDATAVLVRYMHTFTAAVHGRIQGKRLAYIGYCAQLQPPPYKMAIGGGQQIAIRQLTCHGTEPYMLHAVAVDITVWIFR